MNQIAPIGPADPDLKRRFTVDEFERMGMVHRQPRADGTYGVVFEVAAEAMVTPLLVPELTIRLADLPEAA